jgi:hypothetical protein
MRKSLGIGCLVMMIAALVGASALYRNARRVSEYSVWKLDRRFYIFGCNSAPHLAWYPVPRGEWTYRLVKNIAIPEDSWNVMGGAGGLRAGYTVIFSDYKAGDDLHRFFRIRIQPPKPGTVADGFKIRGGNPWCLTNSPSGRYTAFALVTDASRRLYVHDWLRRTTARLASFSGPTDGLDIACLDDGSAIASDGGYYRHAIGREPVPLGDYSQVLTNRSGAFGVTYSRAGAVRNIDLTRPPGCQGAPFRLSIDCAAAEGDWSPAFMQRDYHVYNLISSDDGEWYAALISSPYQMMDRLHVRVAIWRRGASKPCFFQDEGKLRRSVLMGLVPVLAR